MTFFVPLVFFVDNGFYYVDTMASILENNK